MMQDPNSEVGFSQEQSAELTKEHLLALVFELNGLTGREASLKLEMGLDKILKWANELETDGWIKVSIEGASEIYMQLTKEGLKKLHNYESEWIAQQKTEEKKEEQEQREKLTPLERMKQNIAKFKAKILYIKRRIQRFISESWQDITLVFSIFISIYLVWKAISQPNTQIISFLVGSGLSSFTLLLYSHYRRTKKKNQRLTSFMDWLFTNMRNSVRVFALIATGLGMILTIGLYFTDPSNWTIYFYIMVVIACIGQVIYNKNLSIFQIVKFILGISLLFYGVFVLFGGLSITELMFGRLNRYLDVGLSIVLLVVVNSKDETLGITELLHTERKARG